MPSVNSNGVLQTIEEDGRLMRHGGKQTRSYVSCVGNRGCRTRWNRRSSEQERDRWIDLLNRLQGVIQVLTSLALTNCRGRRGALRSVVLVSSSYRAVAICDSSSEGFWRDELLAAILLRAAVLVVDDILTVWGGEARKSTVMGG